MRNYINCKQAFMGDGIPGNSTDKQAIPSKKPRRRRRPHQYGEFYSLLLTTQYSKVDRPLSILEIGVNKGFSLDAWSSIEQVGKVLGVDSDEGQIVGPKDRFTTETLNAYSRETINFLLEKHGKFDIIVDDGSHRFRHQEFFLINYYDMLNDNGVLVCEDVKYTYMDKMVKIRDKYDLWIFDLRWNIHPYGHDEVIIVRYK